MVFELKNKEFAMRKVSMVFGVVVDGKYAGQLLRNRAENSCIMDKKDGKTVVLKQSLKSEYFKNLFLSSNNFLTSFLSVFFVVLVLY